MKNLQSFEEFLNESSPQPTRISKILKELKIKHSIISAKNIKPTDVILKLSGLSNYRGLKKNTKVSFEIYPGGVDPDKFVKKISYEYDISGLISNNTEHLGYDWDWDVIKLDDKIDYKDKDKMTKFTRDIDKIASSLYNWWYDF